MSELLPHLALDLSVPAPTDMRDLFIGPAEQISLEIGFGGGEHLVHHLTRMPTTAIIGVEPFINGMAKLLAAVDDGDGTLARRIRVYEADASDVLAWLPDACLHRVDVLYPDPWPKQRHWKRRFLDDHRLAEIARILQVGATFRFASDIPSYVDWVLERMRRIPDLNWTAVSAHSWKHPFDDWPGTRYEAKALSAGRTPAYFEFVRV